MSSVGTVESNSSFPRRVSLEFGIEYNIQFNECFRHSMYWICTVESNSSFPRKLFIKINFTIYLWTMLNWALEYRYVSGYEKNTYLFVCKPKLFVNLDRIFNSKFEWNSTWKRTIGLNCTIRGWSLFAYCKL